VPGRISVTSFDNTVDSFGQGLTSYDFNVPAIVQAMFDHILEPRRSVPRAEPILEIPGVIMARQSSGPASGAPGA
jgi:DNA-binding LacI/PurR family transcriptional regulator